MERSESVMGGHMITEGDAAAEREKLIRRRMSLKNQMGQHGKQFTRVAMFVKVNDPFGVKTMQCLKGHAPAVRSASWVHILKTLSVEGLCNCLTRIPRHEKYLRKALVSLIAIKRLEQLDRRLATLLAQF